MEAIRISPKMESLHGLGTEAKTFMGLYGILQLV